MLSFLLYVSGLNHSNYSSTADTGWTREETRNGDREKRAGLRGTLQYRSQTFLFFLSLQCLKFSLPSITGLISILLSFLSSFCHFLLPHSNFLHLLPSHSFITFFLVYSPALRLVPSFPKCLPLPPIFLCPLLHLSFVPSLLPPSEQKLPIPLLTH